MDKIVVGKILKAQGIKGELKVLPITNDISRFKKLTEVFIAGNNQYEVEYARIDSTYAYIKLVGLDDRNSVEALRDCLIEVDRQNAVKLPKGSYFVVDLIGCKIIVDGNQIGTLTDVYDYTGGVDTYEVTLQNKKHLLFPALKMVLENVDVENKIITLNKEKLSEVAVYED